MTMTEVARPLDSQANQRRRATRVLAGGVSSNARMLNPHLIVDRGAGSRLWDVDGREYIDYLLGQGPNFLGHAPPEIVAKVAAAQQDGVIYAATHRREIEAAEQVLSVLPWAETMRFGSSSSELVQIAMRVSRYATGRSLVLRFHGHYHGWFDNIAVNSVDHQVRPASGGQLPQAMNELVTIEWNDIDAFRQAVAEHGAHLAAVIMEPIMLNAGCIEPGPGYLEAVRQICSSHGIVLIFDETITGFRVAVGGAAQRYGVAPDLAVYGKAMAAGWPCAALVGRSVLFEGIARGDVLHGGTFNGNTIATAAVLACLERISDGEVHRQLERVGTTLRDALASTFSRYEPDLVVQGLPMAFHARFADSSEPITAYRQLLASDTRRYQRLTEAMVDNGVWTASRGIWYVSAAHDQVDIDETLERVSSALEAVQHLDGPTRASDEAR